MQYFFYKAYYFFYSIGDWRQRRFTPAGLLALALIAISAGLGLDTKQSTIYQVFTFTLPLLAVAMLFSFFFRVRFSVTRKLPKFAMAGEPLSYSLTIDNQTAHQQKGLLIQENLTDPRPSSEEFSRAREPGEEQRNTWDRKVVYHRWIWLLHKNQRAKAKEQPLPALAPHSKEQVKLELLPLRRGYLELPGVIISRPDPLGLFKSCCSVAQYQRVLVLPKRYPLPPLDLPGTPKHHPGGVALASSVGNADEFISLRDYRPGDPIRQIHWKSWAKTGKLIVKNYQDEFFVRHGLILDTFQKQPHSRIFEEAVSLAASFVSTVQTRESLLDLMFVGTEAYCFSSGRGLAHADRMMEILACVQPCHDKPFAELLPMLLNHASLLSGCICILLSWDAERQEMIKALQGLGVPLKVVIIYEGEENEYDPGPMLGDPGNFHVLAAENMEEGLAGF